MRIITSPLILGAVWLAGCAHQPSPPGVAATAPPAGRVVVGVGVDPFPDIIGRSLPASYDEDFDWPTAPIATSPVERAALAVNPISIKASAVGEIPGPVTWSLVEVWKDLMSCDLTLVACDATRCETDVLLELSHMSVRPGESQTAVVRRFEARGGQLWIELDLDYEAESRDMDCGTPCEPGEERAEGCPPDDCGPIWESHSWQGSAVFARVYDGGIRGWNALTSSRGDDVPQGEANRPLPANPTFEPGGHWIGPRPLYFFE